MQSHNKVFSSKVDSTSLTARSSAAKCPLQGAKSVQATNLVRHVSRDTLGSSAIQAARRQPQLMLSNDIPGCCAAIVGHHMQALLPPELPLPLPHPQLAALHGQQHRPRGVELISAAPTMLAGCTGPYYIERHLHDKHGSSADPGGKLCSNSIRVRARVLRLSSKVA